MEPLGVDALINVAVLVALLGFMWKLSRDVKSEGDRIRAEVREDIREFRTEVREDIGKLSGQILTVGERVARIEGRLQMPGVIIVPKAADGGIGRERTELAEADA